MTGPDRFDAFGLMNEFRSDERRLNDALTAFAEREDFGFVWLAYREDTLVGCCSVGYVIGTESGGVVAQVRDLYVVPAARRTGIATALLASLEARLAAVEVTRLEVPAATLDVGAFLLARGFGVTGDRIFSRDR